MQNSYPHDAQFVYASPDLKGSHVDATGGPYEYSKRRTSSGGPLWIWMALAAALAIALIFVAVFGFQDDGSASGSGASAYTSRFYVYAMDNQLPTNRVHVFWHRREDAALTFLDSYPTGGSGFPTAIPGPANVLSSQHSLLRHAQWLFACNAGSNQVTVFEVLFDGTLERVSVTTTEGIFPVSIAALGDRMCVVSAESRFPNAGAGGHLECYRVTITGQLMPDRAFEGTADRLLPVQTSIPFPPGVVNGETSYWAGTPGGSDNPAENGPIVVGRTPGQVSFTPEGDALVVTMKASGIFVYPIVGGVLTGPTVLPVRELRSASTRGLTDNFFGAPAGLPFSFVFHSSSTGTRYITMTEPVGIEGTIPSGGGVISFTIDPAAADPIVQVSDVVTTDPALITTCWIEKDPRNNIAFSANTNEGTLSTFRLNQNGVPSVAVARMELPAGPVGAVIPESVSSSNVIFSTKGTLPLDLAVSGCGDFVYSLDVGFHRIVAYRHDGDGTLSLLGTAVFDLPQNGIVPGCMGIATSPCT